MPALGFFPPNSIPRFAPPAVGAKARKAETEHTRTLPFSPSRRKLLAAAAFQCKAASSSSSSFVTDYDLYYLLGVESSSDQTQIKNAYRALQKRCHPDVAGPPGHDMAIILNEAYAVLSDPSSRSAYDKERAKKAEFLDYTGQPLYSAWLGPESEQRAVFVDEVRCVGCLKCALFARNTFAVESVYGRARVVGQWADPEHTIMDAIKTCPVDCISIVARSDLAALEYVMSRQPRGHVRSTGGAGGASSNIFADVNKFQRRYTEMRDKASAKNFEESQVQREARVSAMRGIRSISSWWYRQSHAAARGGRNLVRFTGKPAETTPNTERLQEAAAKRRAAETAPAAGRRLPTYGFGDEYWTPALLLPSPSKSPATEASTSRPALGKKRKAPARGAPGGAPTGEIELLVNPMILRIPGVIGALAAAAVGFDSGEKASSGLREHVGGSVALEIVNSSWLRILLTGVTWYLVGAAVVGLAGVLGSKAFRRRQEDVIGG